MKSFLALLLVTVSLTCALLPQNEAKPEQKEYASRAPWPAIVTNPEKYHNKIITAHGWLSITKVRGHGILARLFFTREAYDYDDSNLMIALDAKSLMAQRDISEDRWREMSGERVIIQGLFKNATSDDSDPELVDITHFLQRKPGIPIYAK
jgi:hypothetical protein